MLFNDKNEYAMISIYGDDKAQPIGKAVKNALSDKDIKILTPGDPETLEQAAQNSVLVIIAVGSSNDPNLALCGTLKENRMIAADVVAFSTKETGLSAIQILGKGFDASIDMDDTKDVHFSRFLQNKIAVGSRRQASFVLDEEYRRVCDTLSYAPASMIVFDSDKRAVFISDHYFRAYPRIASRLIRGVSVYDAFEMMAKEEGLPTTDPLYEKLQKFWYNLEGSIEFTLDRGISYRLKAVKLPNRRGILVMAQNISGYRTRNTELEARLEALQKELAKLTSR